MFGSTYFSTLIAKHFLQEIVKVVSPRCRVVGVTVHIPNVVDLLLLQGSVHGLADADQAVLIAYR
jgi:hypothetical protein